MKGYVYTLEMLIAVSIIFGSIVFVFSSPVDKPDTELNLIKQSSFDALKYLDENNELKKLVVEGNESEINILLESSIPKSIFFKAVICHSECSASGIPVNRTVVITDYYISGYRNIYLPEKVRLYSWKAG